jgi:hypothetical protein
VARCGNGTDHIRPVRLNTVLQNTVIERYGWRLWDKNSIITLTCAGKFTIKSTKRNNILPEVIYVIITGKKNIYMLTPFQRILKLSTVPCHWMLWAIELLNFMSKLFGNIIWVFNILFPKGGTVRYTQEIRYASFVYVNIKIINVYIPIKVTKLIDDTKLFISWLYGVQSYHTTGGHCHGICEHL